MFVFDWHHLFALNCGIVGAPIQVRMTCRDTVKIGVNTEYRPEIFWDSEDTIHNEAEVQKSSNQILFYLLKLPPKGIITTESTFGH